MAQVMIPVGGFSIDDLAFFPSDGNRYELIEGSLHVSPAPTTMHQRVVGNLFALLRACCSADLEVFGSPLDVVLGLETVLEPDLLVIPLEPTSQRRVDLPPLLVVEVLSPSTRLYDLHTKRATYRDYDVPSYWVVDPGLQSESSITEWRWDGDSETERTFIGDEEARFDWPFPVTVVPSRLIVPGG